MTLLELKGVSKSFGTGSSKIDVLSDINLKVEDGEFEKSME